VRCGGLWVLCCGVLCWWGVGGGGGGWSCCGVGVGGGCVGGGGGVVVGGGVGGGGGGGGGYSEDPQQTSKTEHLQDPAVGRIVMLCQPNLILVLEPDPWKTGRRVWEIGRGGSVPGGMYGISGPCSCSWAQ